MKKKVISGLLVAAMVASMMTGCNKANTPATGDNNGTEAGDVADDESGDDAEDPNTITGDINAADAFVVWGWNDDIKKILDGPFAEAYPEIYSRIVFVNSGGADFYQTQIDALLEDPSNAMYPDLMGLEIDYVQKYVQSGALLSMADLGITDAELASQYEFNRVVCSLGEGTAADMYASFWQCTPGAWCLRADLCEAYLGTTDPVELQAMFATWDKVEETAAKINEASNGTCEILSGWDDLNRVYMNNRTSGWYDENDTIVVDSQVTAFFEEAKLFYDNGYTFNTTQWGADWYSMMGGDGVETNAALAYTGCPWFQYWCLGDDAWKGQCITIAGPQSFYWGGTGLAATSGCADPEVAATIIKFFTCESDSMQAIAKFNCDFVNNADANAALLEYTQTSDDAVATNLASGNGLMYNQNYIEAYCTILDGMTIDTSIVRAEDKAINDKISDFIKEYIQGDADLETAQADLMAYIHDTYNYLNLPE